MKRLCVLLFFILLACEDGPAAPDYGAATGNAASFGIWTPGATDDCTAAQHDAYSVVGPDHKRYPTWHPPIDPVTAERKVLNAIETSSKNPVPKTIARDKKRLRIIPIRPACGFAFMRMWL